MDSILSGATAAKFVVCDGAGSHEWLHRILLGQHVSIPDQLIEELPFWSALRFRELPAVKDYPLGYRLCLVGEEVLSYLPGIAHIAKNVCEQMRSSLRTIKVGKLSVDNSAALQLGLWPAAFAGIDGMSDAQAALMLLVRIARWD